MTEKFTAFCIPTTSRGLDIKDILEKHVGLYLMSAVENTLDLKNHIQKHKNNISKNTSFGSFCEISFFSSNL